MGTNLNSWSSTAANNATADGDIVWNEGQLPGTVNNAARTMMAAAMGFLAQQALFGPVPTDVLRDGLRALTSVRDLPDGDRKALYGLNACALYGIDA